MSLLTATALSEADIKHRMEFRDFVLKKAEPWHREHLGKLYDLWEEWLPRYFDSRLIVPYLNFGTPSHPRAYGTYSPVSSFGGHGEIKIRKSLLTGTHPRMREGAEFQEGRSRFVADVNLHECVHQYQHEDVGNTEDSYHGHGPIFRDKCNEIGKALGLGRVRTSKKRGPDAHLPSCAQWPHCVRPLDYYLGALLDPKEKEPEEEHTALEWLWYWWDAVGEEGRCTFLKEVPAKWDGWWSFVKANRRLFHAKK